MLDSVFLNIHRLRAALGPYAGTVSVTLYDSVDSTNTAAKADEQL